MRRADRAHVADRHLGRLGRHYGYRLAYQWIDITGLPGGTYTVRAMSDPGNWFLETDETDGCGYTKVSFGSSGTSVKVVTSGRGCVNDWQGSTFETQIQWAYDNAITGGCDLDLYCTGNAVTRIHMAMFIDRAMHLPPTDQDFFTDDNGMTGEASINRLAAAGITGGCATNRYCPKSLVTRAQMASFLVRAWTCRHRPTPTTSRTTTARPTKPTSTASSRRASPRVAPRPTTARAPA